MQCEKENILRAKAVLADIYRTAMLFVVYRVYITVKKEWFMRQIGV